RRRAPDALRAVAEPPRDGVGAGYRRRLEPRRVVGVVRAGGDGAHPASGEALGPQQHDEDEPEAEEEPPPEREVDRRESGDTRGSPDPSHDERGLREQDAIEERDQHPAEDDALEASRAAEDDHAE